ncbi:unnamed protein product [Alopecurus aequalis]
MPPLETLLGANELWRPTARGGGWATAAALLLLLAFHFSVLLVRRYRRGRLIQPESAAATPASSTAATEGPSSAFSTGIEGLVTEDDLRQLVSSLGVSAREPELEGWDPVIAMGNDTVSYKAWCEKTKECEHSLAPIQRKFVRVRLLRSGWCIRKVPGRDACQITVLHHEDNGMNIEMAKLAFSKGIWKYICKMNNALRRYPQHHGASVSILTMQRLIKKFPQALQTNVNESHRSPASTAAAVVHSTSSSGTSPCKQLGKKPSRETIASGLLLIGSIVCLSKGRSNLGAQLAMAFFLKKTFKQDKESGSPRGRTGATVSTHS